MFDQSAEMLKHDEARLRNKGLFGDRGDSLSVRILGRDEFLLAVPDGEDLDRKSVV